MHVPMLAMSMIGMIAMGVLTVLMRWCGIALDAGLLLGIDAGGQRKPQ